MCWNSTNGSDNSHLSLVNLALAPNKPHVLSNKPFFFLSWILWAALRPKSWSHTETPQLHRRETDCRPSLCLPHRLQRKMQNGNRSHLMKHEWLKKPVGRACQTADTTPFFLLFVSSSVHFQLRAADRVKGGEVLHHRGIINMKETRKFFKKNPKRKGLCHHATTIKCFRVEFSVY